jgi:diguanylate cyclase (GGDEF)-like protein
MTSLKSRYILFSVFLALLVVSSAYLGYQNLAKARHDTANNVETRNTLLRATHNIRAELLYAYQSLDAFLLVPNQPAYRDKVYMALDKALTYCKKLGEEPWIIAHDEQDAVNELHGSLRQLLSEAEQLFKVRLDPYLQYPSMAAGRAMLGPNREVVDDSFEVALNEIRSDNPGKKRDVYDAFIYARHLWTKIISNFRIYLANRVGSFNEEALPTQEQAIITMVETLKEHFELLRGMDKNGKLGFESSAALEDIERASLEWFSGFNRVMAIHHTADWRIDAKLMREGIAPRVDQVNSKIVALDDRITLSVANDIKVIGDAGRRQTIILLVLAGLMLVFILAVLLSTERMVFGPISAVAKGLKSEAQGKTRLELPVVKAKETRELVDAFSEMRRQVHLRQAELEHHALHDTLTSLPNRALLMDRIEHNIKISNRAKQTFCLLMIDLDRFKEINDTLGHNIGDHLLVDVGKRIQNAVRETDTVARLGGDEFAVLLPNTDRGHAETIARGIVDELQNSFAINGLQLYVAASIGVTFYPDHGTEAQDLLQHADVAMYVAKRNQNGIVVYDEDKDTHSVEHFSMISDLRDALAEDALSLHFQPMFNMKTMDVISVEALLRWEHKEYGFVSPDRIVELAEQTGLIKPITYWVVENALRQVQNWRQKGIELGVSVNLSVVNLRDESLSDDMIAVVEKFKLPRDCLTLEITESAMMANPMRAIEILKKLDQVGIRLSVDDFGTGYSSLAYLKQLPVDELKVDKSFIINLDKDESDAAIVRSTVDLAHNLDLKVVAEGVESETVWNMLWGLGCDHAQGFFMSKPLPANELQDWLLARQA